MFFSWIYDIGPVALYLAVFFWYTQFMKLLPIRLLILTAAFFALSCGSIDNAKRYPHMVADADPVSAGTVEIQLSKFFSSKLNKVDAEVIFYPRLNAVALEFRYELIRYRQFWDAESRKQFADALELYKTDYEAQNLIDRYRRTRSIYGKVRGRVEWEAFKYTKTRVAYPTTDIGYRFRGKAPYFTTLMRSAREEISAGDSSDRGESAQISMFFTRAQADKLVNHFDQDFLMGLLGGKSSEQDEDTYIESYRENDG